MPAIMTISLSQLRPLACHTRAHCATCRTDADWRERVTGVRDFDCPHGVTADNLPSRGLGDTIAKATSAIDTAYLMLDATVHPDGMVEVHAHEIRDPRKPEPLLESNLRIAESRAAVCEECPHKRSVTRQKNGFDVYTVKCDKCGCGGLSLVSGKCPEDLWEIPEKSP